MTGTVSDPRVIAAPIPTLERMRCPVPAAVALLLALAPSCAAHESAPAAQEADTAAVDAIELPALLSSGAVLQRDARVELWGTAPPGATVSIEASWTDAPIAVSIDTDGRFSAFVATGAAGGPHRVEFSAPGCEPVVLDDLVFGEVWLASGQSNMEWSIAASRWSALDDAAYAEEIANAGDDDLRFFQVPNRVALEPRTLCGGAWVAASQDTVPRFSAVALHFARTLREQLGVPVGIVQADWGGTVCEAWTSREALSGRFDGAFDDGLARIDAELANPGSLDVPLPVQQDRWWSHVAEVDPGLEGAWYANELPLDGWRTVQQPGDPDGGFDGTLWLRREVEVPASWAGRDLVLHLGPIDDMDVTWFGGRELAATKDWGRWNDPRHYRVPGELVAGGTTTICVQCVDTGGGAGMHGAADAMYLHPDGASGERVELAGDWSYRRGASLTSFGEFPRTNWFGPNHPTALFNGMIAPLERTRIRGAIWYQGESNRGRAAQYAELFPAMIEDWRGRFRAAGDATPFPFYFVQIAPFALPGDTGPDAVGQWARLRMAQASVVPGASGVPAEFHRAALAHTGMVVTADVGNPSDIHPRRKRPVGERLAGWALADTYAAQLAADDPRAERWRALPHHSPRAVAAERIEDAVRVRFEYEAARDELTTADGAAPTHFELAGADGAFHPATAELVELHSAAGGQAVRLTSPAVPEPTRVRFAWSSDAEPNLITRAGLPLGPFVLSVE